MKHSTTVILFLAAFFTQAVSAEEEAPDKTLYKGFISFHGGTEFKTNLRDLAETLSLAYGGLISRERYLGSFEVGGKVFFRRNIPLTLAVKYSYNITEGELMILGADGSVFIGADHLSLLEPSPDNKKKEETAVKDTDESFLTVGAEAGLFLMKYIKRNTSLLIRAGVRSEFPVADVPSAPPADLLLYVDGGIRWEFL